MEPFESSAQGCALRTRTLARAFPPSQNPVQRLGIGARGAPTRPGLEQDLDADAGYRPSDRHLCAGGPVRRLQAALGARDAKRRGAAGRRLIAPLRRAPGPAGPNVAPPEPAGSESRARAAACRSLAGLRRARGLERPRRHRRGRPHFRAARVPLRRALGL